MFTILNTKIQILNGENVIRQIPVRKERTFDTPEQVASYREMMLKRYTKQIHRKYAKQHPGEPLPKIDILLDVRCKEGYVQKAKHKAKAKPILLKAIRGRVTNLWVAIDPTLPGGCGTSTKPQLFNIHFTAEMLEDYAHKVNPNIDCSELELIAVEFFEDNVIKIVSK